MTPNDQNAQVAQLRQIAQLARTTSIAYIAKVPNLPKWSERNVIYHSRVHKCIYASSGIYLKMNKDTMQSI